MMNINLYANLYNRVAIAPNLLAVRSHVLLVKQSHKISYQWKDKWTGFYMIPNIANINP